jgi:acyl carrier protein
MKDFLIAKIDEIGFAEVNVEDSLWESGVLDSITIVEFATELEEEYEIEIPFDDIIVENFETLSLVIKYLKKKQGE